MSIARKIFDEKTAIAAGFLYAFHPGLIVYTTKLHELTLAVFLFLALTYLLLFFQAKPRVLIAAGLLTGAGIFLRPEFLFLIPAYGIFDFLKGKKFLSSLRRVILLMIFTGMVLSPWIYRGYKIHGRFIFIHSSSAEHLWRGNNPNASGASLTQGRQPILTVAPEDFRRHLSTLNEIEQRDFFMKEAVHFIKTHPGRFLGMTFRKFVYFWSFSPQAGLEYPRIWLILYKMLYSFLSICFIAGIYFTWRNRCQISMAPVVFLFSIFMMVSLVHSLYYVETRHRWMIEPLLMIFSAYGIRQWGRMSHEEKK